VNLAALHGRFPGRRIEYYDSIGSTMQVAAGMPAGAVVVAGEQTAGQGRHGHEWHSAPGCGLYCSIVLGPADATPLVTLALGLATVEAIARATDLRCDIRWPNDVMADDRKLAGILVQLTGTQLIAGIGINVGHRAFPAALATLATSLRLATGREVAHEDLLGELLDAVDRYFRMLTAEGGQSAILDAFTRASSYARGKRVTVDQPGGAVEGVTDGLDPAGFLRVRRDDGTVTLILAGGVRARC
jgi:BirA family transcriptional regulator, biotin operon repressor / biotin---[acetyl-CoA-carboxylase] ligase